LEAIKWTLQMAKKDMKILIIGTILQLIPTGLMFINPVVYSHIIDDVIVGGKANLLIPLVLAVIGCTLLRGVLSYFGSYYVESASQNTLKRMRLYLYDKLEKLD